MLRFITKRNIAAFFLVLMCVQYMPIEGPAISYLKFGAMCLSPLILLTASPNGTKAMLWLGIYCLAVMFSALFNASSFRISTIGYLFAFALTFVMYYNLIYCERAFSADFFIKLLKGLILAYAICLVLQQAAMLVGFKTLPIINLTYHIDRSIWGNSLAIEPSHAARILTVAFLALVRMYEVKWGKGNVTISKIYRDSKWVLPGFLWSMLTMGSGTAFIGLGLLSLYFIKRRYALIVVPMLIALYFASPHINYEPLQRARRIVDVTLTFDSRQIIETDRSAAARIVPLLNTFTSLDLTKAETWLGAGIDNNISQEYLGSTQTVAGVSDYGLISYIISLIFIFTCCIKRFFSLETLILLLLLGAGITNVAYVWGILMIFATCRYFRLYATEAPAEPKPMEDTLPSISQ